jgi:hypothetical protein
MSALKNLAFEIVESLGIALAPGAKLDGCSALDVQARFAGRR